MTEKANHPVQTTAKSIAIVEALDETGGARIFELEERLDMTKGAIHNHLSTLREHGYVRKVEAEYRLSLQFLTLGGRARGRLALYRYGRPRVNQLADDLGMLTNLLTEENGQGVYLYQSRGEYAVNLDTHVGYRISLHNIAVGKAILAHLSHERVEEIVENWGLSEATENTITEKDALLTELETVRDRGYATDHEERTEGLACIAAPVLLEGDVLGAVSVSAPTRRLGRGEFDEAVIGEVESTADELALEIKYA